MLLLLLAFAVEVATVSREDPLFVKTLGQTLASGTAFDDGQFGDFDELQDDGRGCNQVKIHRQLDLRTILIEFSFVELDARVLEEGMKVTVSFQNTY